MAGRESPIYTGKDEYYRIKNPDNIEVASIYKEQSTNPYIELQRRVIDTSTHEVISTSTVIPYLMNKHGLANGTLEFINGFQNHGPEVYSELAILEQDDKSHY